MLLGLQRRRYGESSHPPRWTPRLNTRVDAQPNRSHLTNPLSNERTLVMKNRLFLTLAIAVAGVAVTLTTAARPASANVPWHPNQVPSPFGNPCPFATSALPLIAASMAKDGSGQLYLSGELFTPCASVSIYISDSDMPGSRYLAGTA